MSSLFCDSSFISPVFSQEEKEKIFAACLRKIDDAISHNAKRVFLEKELGYFGWSAPKNISIKIQDHYWNVRQIWVRCIFSTVDIDYVNDADEKYIAVKCFKNEYDRIFTKIQKQLYELEDSIKEVVIKWNAVRDSGFSNRTWLHIMREVSANLAGGRIVRIDGLWAIRRT